MLALSRPADDPRTYQQEVISGVIGLFSRGYRKGVIEMPTGSGKTLTATWVIYELLRRAPGEYALFLVPTIELCRQTFDSLVRHFGQSQVGRVQAEYNIVGRHITVATKDTLKNPDRLSQLLQSQDQKKFCIVVCDEAHLSLSQTYRDLIPQVLAPYGLLLGPTATPYRADGQNLRQVYPDGLFASVDYLSLVAAGYLADVEVYDIPSTLDLSGIDLSRG